MTEQQNAHLHKIAIKGFKSIKNLDLEMRPVNILIGANGAGKSNFISLFTFLKNLSDGKLQTYVELQGFANTFFHFGSKKTPTISIDIKVGANGYHADFVHSESDDSLVFKEEHCTFSGSPKIFPVKGKLGESGLLAGSEAKSDSVRQYTRKYMQKCRVYHFHDTGSTAGFKQASKLHESDYLYNDAANIAAYLYRLKEINHSHYLDIVSAVQAVAPFFHDFYLEPRGQKGDESILLKWTHKEHDSVFSANQLSDGTARFICMATLFLQPDELMPNTIVLDEPELGLHPAALDVLADLVKSASKTNQVICSTQSVTFANQFLPDDFIVVNQVRGVSKFKRLKAEELKHWLDDYGMGDIWTKNLIGGRPEW